MNRLITFPSISTAFSLIALLAGSLSLASEPSAIGRVLQPFVDRHELAGAVTLVASKDKILSVEVVGYADVAARKPMHTDTLFWIASMSKPITAAALMMLVDEGKVRLDDPVQKYLPKFAPRIMSVTADGAHVRLQEPRRAILLRHLLSHTSGIPAVSSLETPTLDVFPLAVRVQSYALEPLMFEPGSLYSYSNAGINTAAYVVEVVTGMPFEQFLQQRIFDPLGMKDTTFWPVEEQLQRLAKSYKPNAAGTGLEEISITQLHYPLTDRRQRYAMPAGGLFSTAGDVGKFCQMILSGGKWAGKRYLSQGAVQEMTHNQLFGAAQQEAVRYRFSPLEPDGYGLGWQTHTSGGTFEHGGAYATDMSIDPRNGLITVWLVQHVGFPGTGNKSQEAFEHAVAGMYPKEP